MNLFFKYGLYCSAILFLAACREKTSSAKDEEVRSDQVQTPVTVTNISNGPMTEYIELNAISVFQQDNIVKSTITGYLKSVNAKIGQFVGQGQELFILKTKEAESLGNTINQLDSTFHFSGVVRVNASESGFITDLPHQVGDYVQDGEQLAVISNSKSFGFVLNLPYELKRYISLNKHVDVLLPDSTHLDGWVASFMPTVDSASQTQQVLIKVLTAAFIPENLIVKVRLVKTDKKAVSSLPKAAILSDEAQSNFWVMKMIDSVTSVKVPVTKGLELGDRVEILKPQFSESDKILLTGNYGLADTARVRIVQ